MSEPTLQDCINYMRSQIKQMEKHPRNYEFNLPYYRKTVELLEKEQRPHGEWIEHRTQNGFGSFHSEYECSNCRDEVWQKTEWQFCPNCGADMRKEGDREVNNKLLDEFCDEIRKTLFTRPPCTNDSHHFIPYNSGNMICSKCGKFAKIGRLGLKEGDRNE